MRLRLIRRKRVESITWIPNARFQKVISRVRERVKEELDLDMTNIDLIYLIEKFFSYHTTRVAAIESYENFQFGKYFIFKPKLGRIVSRYQRAIMSKRMPEEKKDRIESGVINYLNKIPHKKHYKYVEQSVQKFKSLLLRRHKNNLNRGKNAWFHDYWSPWSSNS